MLYRTFVVTVQSLFVTLWTVAHQTPLSIGFPRQQYCSGLSSPPPGDLPDLGIKPACPVLTGGFFTAEAPGKPHYSLSTYFMSAS